MLDLVLQALPTLSQDELRSLNSAVVNQLKANRAYESAKAIRTLKVGDTGKLVGLRGKWVDQACEVVEILRTKVVVTTPNYKDWRTGRPMRVKVPASCVEVAA